MPVAAFSEEAFRDLLPFYYRRLFPFKQFFEWITYGNEKSIQFRNREFSFTLEHDIYVRYQSFRTTQDMEFAIKNKNPHKIDIGAVYNYPPVHHKRVALIPSEKELVFDIDMTDYDDVRSCCQGADVCIKCWKFMSIACKVLDKALRDDFNYQHLLWVFSGRRGIHCWVCDEAARRLDNGSRAAVAGYLQVDLTKAVNLARDKTHPAISRALSIIEQDFVQMLMDDQDILGTDDKIKKMVEKVPQEFSKDLFEKLKALPTSRDRWTTLVSHLRQAQEENPTGRSLDKLALDEIMLRHAYPRLDINVSTGLNHLLKAPFCVHPKSGKVCVPFNPKSVDKFDPGSIPTLSQLVEEVRCFGEKEKMRDEIDAGNEARASKAKANAPPAVEAMETGGEEKAEGTSVDSTSEDKKLSVGNVEGVVEKIDSSVLESMDVDSEVKTEGSVGNGNMEVASGDSVTAGNAEEASKAAKRKAGGVSLPDAGFANLIRSDVLSQQESEVKTRCIMEETPADEVVGLTATEMKALKEKQQAAFTEISKSRVVTDYKKTSMYKGILVFETFLRKLKAGRSAQGWNLEGEIQH